MSDGNRRDALRLLALLASGTHAVAAWPAIARDTLPERAFPQTDFILRRDLARDLSGGAKLTVTREWRGRFTPAGRGAMAHGEQISCTVDAPAPLQPIAEIERKRVAPGPFPATLDSAGRMLGIPLDDTDSKLRAIGTALRIVDEANVTAGTKSDARQFLAGLAEATQSVISAIPADLFFPQQGEAHDSRELALDGGMGGTVEVSLAAMATSTGLLERIERRIVTRIGPRPSVRWSCGVSASPSRKTVWFYFTTVETRRNA